MKSLAEQSPWGQLWYVPIPSPRPLGPTDWEGVSASLEGPESAPNNNLGHQELLRNGGPQGPLPSFLPRAGGR